MHVNYETVLINFWCIRESVPFIFGFHLFTLQSSELIFSHYSRVSLSLHLFTLHLSNLEGHSSNIPQWICWYSGPSILPYPYIFLTLQSSELIPTSFYATVEWAYPYIFYTTVEWVYPYIFITLQSSELIPTSLSHYSRVSLSLHLFTLQSSEF